MPERKTILVKKYSDRRLYDSSARRYVNLEELARLIRGGAEVRVVDARSGKDLTRVVLTQIIMEENRDTEAGLPVKLLERLVVASDRATHDFLAWYLDTAFELYKKAGTAVRSGLSEARSAVSSPRDYLRRIIAPETHPSESVDAEMRELRRQIEELKSRVAESGAPRKPKRRPRSAKAGR